MNKNDKKIRNEEIKNCADHIKKFLTLEYSERNNNGLDVVHDYNRYVSICEKSHEKSHIYTIYCNDVYEIRDETNAIVRTTKFGRIADKYWVNDYSYDSANDLHEFVQFGFFTTQPSELKKIVTLVFEWFDTDEKKAWAILTGIDKIFYQVNGGIQIWKV